MSAPHPDGSSRSTRTTSRVGAGPQRQRHPVAKPLTRPPSSSPGRQEGRRLRAGGAGRCRAGRARGPAVGWNARAPPWTLGVAGATWAAVCLGLLLYDSRSSCRRPPQGTPDGPRRTANAPIGGRAGRGGHGCDAPSPRNSPAGGVIAEPRDAVGCSEMDATAWTVVGAAVAIRAQGKGPL